jgi:hypothetical protein
MPVHDQLHHQFQAVDVLLHCSHPLQQLPSLLMMTTLFPPDLLRLLEVAMDQ